MKTSYDWILLQALEILGFVWDTAPEPLENAKAALPMMKKLPFESK